MVLVEGTGSSPIVLVADALMGVAAVVTIMGTGNEMIKNVIVREVIGVTTENLLIQVNNAVNYVMPYSL